MSDTTKSGRIILIGFIICGFLIAVTTFTGYYATAVQERHIFELVIESKVSASFNDALQHFNTALLAALKDQSDDLEIKKLVDENCRNALKNLSESSSCTRKQRTKEITESIANWVEDFRQLNNTPPQTDEERLALRAEKMEISEKVSSFAGVFQKNSKDQLTDAGYYLFRLNHFKQTQIIVSGVASLVICFITYIVISRKLAKPNNFDLYSPPESGESKDLRIVADKLQEAVNLLRQ